MVHVIVITCSEMRHTVQTVQVVFLAIPRKAETVSHPENPCSSSNPQSTSDHNML